MCVCMYVYKLSENKCSREVTNKDKIRYKNNYHCSITVVATTHVPHHVVYLHIDIYIDTSISSVKRICHVLHHVIHTHTHQYIYIYRIIYAWHGNL